MESSSSEKKLLKPQNGVPMGHTQKKKQFFFQKYQNQILSFQNLFILIKYHMFWPSYECFSTDGLHLFWFSQKIAHAHISGRQNKNKLKEKHVESSEQLLNRVPTSIYTSFVSVDFERNMPDSCRVFGCKNRRSTTCS